MEKYKFNITLVGTGASVDDAFQNAIESFCATPEDAIEGEVIYVSVDKPEEDKEVEHDN